MLFCYIVSFATLISGIIFFTGKGASYIKGYTKMSEAEKNRININALCKNLSVMFFLAAVIFAIAGYSEVFRLSYLKWIMLGWMVLGCADVLFINKSKLYTQHHSDKHHDIPDRR